MDEFASLKGSYDGQKPSNFHAQSVAILVLSPFLTFVMLEALFSFAYSSSPVAVWVVAAALALFSLFLLALPTKRLDGPMFYMQLGVLCLIAVGSGAMLGNYNWNSNMSHDAAYAGQRTYSNVIPTEAALAHLDAGKIMFSPDSMVNINQAVGYKDGSGSMYCVAPMIDSTLESQERAEFFAAGKDCCQVDGRFTCGESSNANAHGGLVYLKFDNSQLLDKFRKAAQTFAVVHGIPVSPDALFVKYVQNPERAANAFQNSGVGFFLGSSALYLVFSIILGFGLHFSQRDRGRITKTAGL